MKFLEYNRASAVAYAKKWAYSRNPDYYDFSRIGGDCTAFASQCLYAGCGVMNFTPVFGWYYLTAADRTPSWTGVEYFYRFLTENAENAEGTGPYAKEISAEQLELGDFVQFGRGTGDFYHTPIVVGFSHGTPLLAAHTYDTYGKPLTGYRFEKMRCLHILGARSYE